MKWGAASFLVRRRFGPAKRSVIALSVLAGLLCGCAVNPAADSGASLSKEQVVAKRAAERWALLVAGDPDSAYPFMSPATREVLSLRAYRATLNPRLWKGARVAGVECSSDDLCKAKVLLAYQVSMKMGASFAGEQDLTEVWRRTDGQWWFVPDRLEGRIGQ